MAGGGGGCFQSGQGPPGIVPQPGASPAPGEGARSVPTRVSQIILCGIGCPW